MTKVVINRCHGGFGLSYSGVLRYCELAGIEVWPEKSEWSGIRDNFDYWLVPPGSHRINLEVDSAAWAGMTHDERQTHNTLCESQLFWYRNIQRDDKHLVAVVEELGSEAGGRFSELGVVEIPDDVDWTIEEYDGLEWVSERHRTWR